MVRVMSWMLLCEPNLPGLVCLAMWAIGLCMFLIPVVPGAPIFFFGGALIPTKCDSSSHLVPICGGRGGDGVAVAPCWLLGLVVDHIRATCSRIICEATRISADNYGDTLGC